MLTEKGLDKNMKIKHVLIGNRVLESLRFNKISSGGITPPEPTTPRPQCQVPAYAPDSQ